MGKKITVSVGIPAYNEEKNIINLLTDIFNQAQDNFELKEIIIVCDGSTDRTAEYAEQMRSSKIKVFEGSKRLGKSSAINRIFQTSREDIIVLFDADIRLGDKYVLEKLISCFKNHDAALVGGNRIPFPPKNFLQRGIYSTFKVFNEAKLKINGGQNIFSCQGGCIALRKDFAQKNNLPPIISDDAYLYLACISHGYKYLYQEKAVTYYKMPNNLSDYLVQLFRSTPKSVGIILNVHFGKLVKREFHRPLKFYLRSIFKAFMEDPIPTIYIILVNLVAKPFIPIISRRYGSYWPVAKSTK